MGAPNSYLPWDVFAPAGSSRPRAFISPQRYIQGPNLFAEMGRYLSLVRAQRVGVLISAGGERRHYAILRDSIAAAGIEPTAYIFGGECSIEEIDRQAGEMLGRGIDCVLAVGGGKCVDAGKAVAYRLGAPYAIAPTLASNDAPCSALSVLYTPAGVFAGVEFYPSSPALVVVDTAIVAAAPERYLVAGMGDAMATWYEAAACLRNPAAANIIGARPTLAASAIGEVCAACLFREGVAAAHAVANRTVTESLEAVTEANTLLSGLGFESGGLAAAHGFAQSFTSLPPTVANHLHGEMVAMGTLAQLMLESRPDEARRVAEFFAAVGLPVHLGQLSVDPADRKAIATVIDGVLAFPYIGNQPEKVDRQTLHDALLGAHELGTSMADRAGTAAFDRLHAARTA